MKYDIIVQGGQSNAEGTGIGPVSQELVLSPNVWYLDVEKTVEVVRGFGFYPSDQAKFRRGVGVCALKKSPVCGYYMDKIHTRRDTVLDEENVALLCSGTVRLLRAQKEKEETYAK